MTVIKYTIEEINNTFVLFSVVDTDFGGAAKNYVCADKDYKKLVAIAENEGWEVYE